MAEGALHDDDFVVAEILRRAAVVKERFDLRDQIWGDRAFGMTASKEFARKHAGNTCRCWRVAGEHAIEFARASG